MNSYNLKAKFEHQNKTALTTFCYKMIYTSLWKAKEQDVISMSGAKMSAHGRPISPL